MKDFKLSQADPGTGKLVNIRDGSVRQPAVRAALDKIGCNDVVKLLGNFTL